MNKYFSIQTAITMIIVLVVFYVIAYWISGSKKSSMTGPSAETLKSKSDCEKYGYKWDEVKNVCTKI